MIYTKRPPLEKKFFGYINNPRVGTSSHKKGEITSLYFAELTNKKHNHIMRDIRELKCSDAFKAKHFSESFYRSVRDRYQTRIRPQRYSVSRFAHSYRISELT